jgi:hypothetical protein
VNSDEILKAKLAKALAECERLRDENARLRLRIGEDLKGDHQDLEQPSLNGDVKAHASAAVTVDSPPAVKVSCSRICFTAGTTCTRSDGKEGTTSRAIRRRVTRNGTRRLHLVGDRRNHFALPSYFH